MSRISIQDLEKMTKSKYVCTQKLRLADSNVFHDDCKRVMEFDIFDGFAYCPDFEGHEYYMDFPKTQFIKMAKQMEKNIREYINLDEHEPIKESHILMSYNTLHLNN